MDGHHRRNPIATLLAQLAVVVILFSPAIATANCCCKQAERRIAAQQDVAVSADSQCCCQKKKQQAVVPSCCQGDSSCASPLSSDCQCAQRCLKLLRTTVGNNVVPKAVSLIWLDVALMDASDEHTVSRLQRTESFVLLSAQDRCALNCSWLK